MQTRPTRSGGSRCQPKGHDDAHDADAIGSRIRKTRRGKGLTLSQLAEQTGLSIGSISQVERGLVSPTIRTVYAIANALGVAPAAIIDPAGVEDSASESPYVARRARQPQVLDANGVLKILASPPEQGRYRAYRVRIEPGGSSGEDGYAHKGDEIGYVIRGNFSLQVNGRTFVLAEGDCFAFPSSLKHRFFNDGETLVEIIWINSLA